MRDDRAKGMAALTLFIALVVALVAVLQMLSGGTPRTVEPDAHGERRSIRTVRSMQRALETVGGIEALTLATAEGAFDLVRFDPLDPNRLIATDRRSYGEAENQGSNEEWVVRDGLVDQHLWDNETPHDFVHFNPDGTITRWVHPGGSGFAARIAEVLDRNEDVIFASKPIYASRFVVDSDTLFALTGDGTYGAQADHSYVALVADDGTRTTVLSSGSGFGWIDSPAPGLVVAYPNDVEGVTRVWNAETLAEIQFHALAGRSHRRAAISGDGSIAVAATFTGELEVIDLHTSTTSHAFGSVDVDGIDQPVTLSDDGSIAVTVEHDGTVTLWSVAEGAQIVSIEGQAVQPRWLSEYYAPRSATAVSNGATRLAVRNEARPAVPTSWTIIDIDVDSWLSG